MATQPEKKEKPVPVPDELTKPYWDAAKEHRLVIQRCKDCGYYNHPPKPACDICQSENLEFEQVSGKGKIYSYTTMHQRNVPGYEEEVPYLNIAVELDEQPDLIMITNLIGGTVDDVRMGLPTEVVFQEVNDDITLPQFRLLQ